jgi:DNA primase
MKQYCYYLGVEGALKIRSRLISNFIVRIVKLPEGKDPDDLNKVELQKILINAV